MEGDDSPRPEVERCIEQDNRVLLTTKESLFLLKNKKTKAEKIADAFIFYNSLFFFSYFLFF